MTLQRKHTLSLLTAVLTFALLPLRAATPASVLSATLQGRVVVQGGAKPSGWVVVAQPEPLPELPAGRAGRLAVAPVGPDGSFTLSGVGEGRQCICLYMAGRLDVDSVAHLKSAASQAGKPVELKTKAPRARVEFALQGDDKKALGRKVKVHLFNTYGEVHQGAGAARSDAAGVVAFAGLPAGRYDLWVEARGGGARYQPADVPGCVFRGLEVTAGEGAQRLELAVPQAGGAKGRLVLPDGVTPAKGCTIAVQSGTQPPAGAKAGAAAVGYARGAHECYAEAVAGADGSFVLNGLTLGMHLLDVRKPGDPMPWCTLTAKVLPGQIADLGTVTLARNGWRPLFDGKTLTGWKESDFYGHPDVWVEGGRIILPTGSDMTGVTKVGETPKIDYEVTYEAMRVEGTDFFASFTFPVGNDLLSFVTGGWGGGTVGLSSIDGYDASENETSKSYDFSSQRWYRMRVRVTRPKVEAWIDSDPMVDLKLKDHRLSIRIEMEENKPFGFSSWETTGAIRDIRIRELDAPSVAP